MASSSVPLPPFVKPAFCKDFTLLDRIAYRGDTRSPEIIFREGFWNKQAPHSRWDLMVNAGEPNDNETPWLRLENDFRQRRKKKEVAEKDFADGMIIPPLAEGQRDYVVRSKRDTSKFFNVTLNLPGEQVRSRLHQHYFANVPEYRDNAYATRTGKVAQFDISQETAVCLTLRADVAPYFPKETARPPGQWIWVYAVRLYAALPTYRLQARDRPEITFAEEVAVERVPATYVICAVQCWRVGFYPEVQFNFAPRIWWNPSASVVERSRSMGEIARAFYPFQGYRAQCPTGLASSSSSSSSSSTPPPPTLVRRRIREFLMPEMTPLVDTDIIPATDPRWRPY